MDPSWMDGGYWSSCDIIATRKKYRSERSLMGSTRMQTHAMRMAELDLRVVEPVDPVAPSRPPVVVLLHGFSMRADDLAPFGASMGLPAVFVFPDGPIDLTARGLDGRAWWMIDVVARDAAISRGEDRDLSAERPAGLGNARDGLVRLVQDVQRAWPDRPLFLGGFSQGAILTLDMVVRTGFRPAGLVLLSGARVDAATLAPRLVHLRDVPIFQSHGRSDRELSFAAAEALRNELVTAGAAVQWWPFDGGHEIPLPVLRELKKFIRLQARAETEPMTNDIVRSDNS